MEKLLAIALIVSTAFAAKTDTEAKACARPEDCDFGYVCSNLKKVCVLNIFGKDLDMLRRRELSDTGNLPEECFTAAPNVINCVNHSTTDRERIIESNNVPPYPVQPYCPFGIGQGYCQSPVFGNSTDCDVFRGMTCPCDPNESEFCPENTPSSGDILTPYYQRFVVTLHPDPTDSSKPKNLYESSWLEQVNIGGDVIAVHINGVQIKGPSDATGTNVDEALFPLSCGAHVTPYIAPGPVYHYHKSPDCGDIETPGSHGPLIGYTQDGFDMYGFGDFTGSPVLDECGGHFGLTPSGEVKYHYHTTSTYNMENTTFVPYFMGCQGPAKGRCQETQNITEGINTCGPGCGKDLCIQPGTDCMALIQYIADFQGGRRNARKWLANFSLNACEDSLYRKHNGRLN